MASLLERARSFDGRPGTAEGIAQLQQLYYDITGYARACTACHWYELLTEVEQFAALGIDREPHPPYSSQLMATTGKFRWKQSFKKQTAILNDPETRVVGINNFADTDEPLLRRHGYGHLIEKNPDYQEPTAASEPTEDDDALPALSHLNKSELRAAYEAEIGEAPAEDLTKAQLTEAIEAKRATA
ncbi:hypothetical protein HER32_11985 [Hymenobacter sp. BT18]|uniref:hypothetical protein n=1 Tax=Hymenobacter sp. BT18 TaxID=2835648 RepID=UPI00143E6A4C|nr:hypothetical protein [Hymenobacter sp. BT18]QIX61862.1 hypothetical protein HER32_11985 [Hymenobacter sp. BT18]